MSFIISAAAAGVIILFACGVLIFGLRKSRQSAAAGYVLIPLMGCADPEQRVRSAYWEERGRSPANRRRIVIVTSLGSGQRYIAGLLAAQLDGVDTCDISALADYIIKHERMLKP